MTCLLVTVSDTDCDMDQGQPQCTGVQCVVGSLPQSAFFPYSLGRAHPGVGCECLLHLMCHPLFITRVLRNLETISDC